MRLIGELLKITRQQGDFKNATGETISYDFRLYSVLDKESAVVRTVKVRANDPTPPEQPGDTVEWDVDVPATIRLGYVGSVEPATF